MTRNRTHDRTASLVKLVERLDRLHQELHEVIRHKIDRMRLADTEGIRQSTAREGVLVERIAEQEGLRRQLMTAIGQQMGLAPHAGRAMTLAADTGLARRLPDPRRSELLAAAAGLRTAVGRVAESNRLAGLIATQILRHVRHVFSAVTGTGVQAGSYSRRGEPLGDREEQVASGPLLDAMG